MEQEQATGDPATAAALIALASWLLGVACAVGGALGSMPPSRQLRHAKARKQLPVARVIE